MNFSKVLNDWFFLHRRELPWRQTKDPYCIWLSEVILQQTKVNQGLDYYLSFINRFPSVESLAAADEAEVLKLWQGLGYYTRARNLHKCAKIVAEQFGGEFPANASDLQKLPGIGNYTAAAISSIVNSEPVAAVDGNVFRVLSRFYGIDVPTDSSEGKRVFQDIAKDILDPSDPGNHNQAMMEFGALQCVPRSPDCSVCPVASECVAREKGLIHNLPVKKKKQQQRQRFFYYLVVNLPEGVVLKKRMEKDIWKHLYDFPLVESGIRINPNKFSAHPQFSNLVNDNNFIINNITGPVVHQLTHQRIEAYFLEISTEDIFSDNSLYLTVPIHELINIAVPQLVHRYLITRSW